MAVSLFKIVTGVAVLAGAGSVRAETVTYSYDAQGRLTRVERTGAPQGTETAQYTFDQADNRTRVQTGSTIGGASAPPPVLQTSPPPADPVLAPSAGSPSLPGPSSSSAPGGGP